MEPKLRVYLKYGLLDKHYFDIASYELFEFGTHMGVDNTGEWALRFIGERGEHINLPYHNVACIMELATGYVSKIDGTANVSDKTRGHLKA